MNVITGFHYPLMLSNESFTFDRMCPKYTIPSWLEQVKETLSN